MKPSGSIKSDGISTLRVSEDTIRGLAACLNHLAHEAQGLHLQETARLLTEAAQLALEELPVPAKPRTGNH